MKGVIQIVSVLLLIVTCTLGSEITNRTASINKKTCPSISTRMVNGKKALPGVFPYQVSIRKNLGHICGGSIINDRWILTAAHCVQGLKDDDLLIVAGTNRLDFGGVSYKSKKILYHPGYDSIRVVNDIGLIMVNATIKFTKKIKPIALPNENVDGDRAMVAGWGKLDDKSFVASRYLQYISTCLMDIEDCKKDIPGVESSQICSFTQAGQGNCNGDSGGPLVVKNVQVGIVSYIMVECAFGYPDVYTRVWSFRSWINEQMLKYR